MALWSKLKQQIGNDGASRAAAAFDLGADNLRLINRVLAILAVLLAVFVVFQLQRFDTEAYTENIKPAAGRDLVLPGVQDFEPKTYYIGAVQGKNLFTPLVTGETKTGTTATVDRESAVQQKLRELKGSLVVVGVAWEQPRVVMLYDKRERKTYFLQQSQEIAATGIRVKKIDREEIVIGTDKFDETL